MLKEKISKAIKVGGLALLLNISYSEVSNAQLDLLFNPKKRLIKNYIEAVMNKDLEKMKSYMSSRRADRYRVSNFGLETLKSLYKGYRSIESYVPEEGEDRPNVYWLKHKDGKYSRFILVDENGWKVDDISGPK